MNRRKFITLVGTWSLGRSWRAQQSGRMRRNGVLLAGDENVWQST